MEWYWWVLIAAAVVAGGYVKLKLLGKWMASRAAKAEAIEEE
jgi:hypothetical protein